MDTVRRWMSSPAITVPETMHLPDARRLMQERRIRRLPVVNAANRLVGIVTEGDINRISDSPAHDVRGVDLYHTAATLPLSSFMTRNVIAVTPETPVLLVAQMLLEHRIGGVPVVEGDRLVGVITESDLFRLIAARSLLTDAPEIQAGEEPTRPVD